MSSASAYAELWLKIVSEQMGRDIWKTGRLYELCRKYMVLITKTSFSSVKIVGRENIPTDGAVIFAPNHCAAMMDPMVMLMTARRATGFGSRSDIFSNPMAARLLYWSKTLPIARERNGLSEIARNLGTIDDIVDCVDHGVPFCMYSEGTHRPERGLLPIKKGLFKIAKKASDTLEKPVYVVPVGVCYEYFFHEMGNVSVHVGEPVEIGEYFRARADVSEAEIYREICSEFHDTILGLIGEPPARRHDLKGLRLAALAALSPIWAACALLSFPIWLPVKLIMAGMEDKAWTHTVYFAFRGLLPVLWPFFALFAYWGNLWRRLVSDMRPGSIHAE